MNDKLMMLIVYALFCMGNVFIFGNVHRVSENDAVYKDARTMAARDSAYAMRLSKRRNAGIKIRVLDLRKAVLRKRREIVESAREMDFFKSLKRENSDREIYESLSYMRNLIIAHKGSINSDTVISRLAERDSALKEVYIKMLSLMRMGRVKEAEDVMCEETGTEAGREFAALLTSWEHMQPEQLSQIIVSYRKSIRENCITKQKKRDEMISNFIYFPATANIFLIFINFIYISYFMQQKEMFEMMF